MNLASADGFCFVCVRCVLDARYNSEMFLLYLLPRFLNSFRLSLVCKYSSDSPRYFGVHLLIPFYLLSFCQPGPHLEMDRDGCDEGDLNGNNMEEDEIET